MTRKPSGQRNKSPSCDEEGVEVEKARIDLNPKHSP